MRTSVRVLAPFVALLLAAACNAPRATSPATSAPSGSAAASTAPSFTGKTLNIVTGGTGAVYIVYGAGLAELLNRSEEHTSELQSLAYLVCRLLLEKKKK